MSGLIDFNLTTNFGKKGLTPEGWKHFTRSLEKRFDALDKKCDDYGDVCKATKAEFATYVKVRKAELKHGCEPMQEFKRQVEDDKKKLAENLADDSTAEKAMTVAVAGLIIGVIHLLVKGGFLLGEWITYLIHQLKH